MALEIFYRNSKGEFIVVILRELRTRTGITLEEFSNLCDISSSHMSFIERGMRRPHLDKAKHIVKIISDQLQESWTIEDVFFAVRRGVKGTN